MGIIKTDKFIILKMDFQQLASFSLFFYLCSRNGINHMSHIDKRIMSLIEHKNYYELYLNHDEAYELAFFMDDILVKMSRIDDSSIQILNDIKKELKSNLREGSRYFGNKNL